MSENNSIKELYFSPDGKNAFYQIIQDNLYEGLELKNYNSLCAILQLEKPYPHSNAKIRHYAAWHCFFDFEFIPDTHRIRITKIYPYNEIKEYISPISNGVSKEVKKVFHYYEYIIPLLEDYSARNGYQYTISMSNTELFTALGFINKSYASLYESVRTLCKVRERRIDNIETFVAYDIISGLLASNIIPAQRKVLKNRQILLEWKDVYYIKKVDKSITMKATDKQVELITKIKNEIREKKEDLYNGTYFLSVLMANDSLINVELERRKIDFTLDSTKKEYTFSKENFKPCKLDNEIVDTYRHLINDNFLNDQLKKKLDNLTIDDIGTYNTLNPKYNGKSKNEILDMIKQKIINCCKM